MTVLDQLHIDDFCKDTAKVFLLLYKSFPQKTILYVEDICGPDEPDEFGLHAPRFQAAFSTVIWLAEADYLAYSSLVLQEAFEQTTLTHKGFTFLTGYDSGLASPLADNNQVKPKTRIEVIADTLRTGSSDTLKELILRYLNDSK